MNKRKQKELRQLNSGLTLAQVEARIAEAAKALPSPVAASVTWGPPPRGALASLYGSVGWKGAGYLSLSDLGIEEPDPLQVGDLVTREGSDVHIVRDVNTVGNAGTFECLVAPMPDPWDGRQWCRVGDVENNMCRRYLRLSDEQLESVRDMLPEWLADVPA